jgi:hypothetical protein
MRKKVLDRPIPDRSSLLGISYNTQATKDKEQFKKEIRCLKLNWRKDIEFVIRTERTAKSPARKKDRTKRAYTLDLLHTIGQYLLVIAIGCELYFHLAL